ncbi:hypothetical protein FRC12_009011 [Ceratobasidium sp. 428]|nr:hypothetical protein FRC12_009011 [Ceratobasidium sp. 428]
MQGISYHCSHPNRGLSTTLTDNRRIHGRGTSSSFICFSLALFNYPGARGAWGRTAEQLDSWTTELLNGPGAGIPDQGMSDLVKMTRNHDLGIGYMIARPWPGAPVVYEFDEEEEDVGATRRDEEEDELWVEEDSDSSESEPRGRERTVKPLGASYRR